MLQNLFVTALGRRDQSINPESKRAASLHTRIDKSKIAVGRRYEVGKGQPNWRNVSGILNLETLVTQSGPTQPESVCGQNQVTGIDQQFRWRGCGGSKFDHLEKLIRRRAIDTEAHRGARSDIRWRQDDPTRIANSNLAVDIIAPAHDGRPRQANVAGRDAQRRVDEHVR